MAGPGDAIAAAAGGQRRMRASDADREQAIEALKAAFVQGRLDRDEFGLRVGQALASRTCTELAALTADIPAGPTGARPPEPARESVNKKAVAAVAFATAALIGMCRVMLITPDGSPAALPVGVVTLVLLLAAGAGWLLLFYDWRDKRAVRQSAMPEQRKAGDSGPGRSRLSKGYEVARQEPSL